MKNAIKNAICAVGVGGGAAGVRAVRQKQRAQGPGRRATTCTTQHANGDHTDRREGGATTASWTL
jgi:hypothetical protein